MKGALFSASLALLAVPAAHADERTVMLSGFDRLRVDGPFEVTLRMDKRAGARIIGERRAVDQVSVRQEGRTLIVSPSQNGWGGWPGEHGALPTVEVAAPALRSAFVRGGGRLAIDRMEGARVDLGVTGSGAIAVRNADADQLNATLAGSGTIAVAGRALRAQFMTSGTGTIDATDLSVRDLKVRAESAGASRFTAEQTADVTALGLGSVVVSGAPSCTVRGPGPVQCGRNSLRRPAES